MNDQIQQEQTQQTSTAPVGQLKTNKSLFTYSDGCSIIVSTAVAMLSLAGNGSVSAGRLNASLSAVSVSSSVS